MKKLLALGAMLLSCAEMASVNAMGCIRYGDQCFSMMMPDSVIDQDRRLDRLVTLQVESFKEYNDIVDKIGNMSEDIVSCCEVYLFLNEKGVNIRDEEKQETSSNFALLSQDMETLDMLHSELLSQYKDDSQKVSTLNANLTTLREMFHCAQNKFNSAKDILGIE